MMQTRQAFYHMNCVQNKRHDFGENDAVQRTITFGAQNEQAPSMMHEPDIIQMEITEKD